MSCYVDVWAFEYCLGHARDYAKSGDGKGGARYLKRASSVYTGRFLSGETASWMEVARERLHNKYIRALREIADTLEKSCHAEEAHLLREKAAFIHSQAGTEDLNHVTSE
jgi:two-component SAPR family response regulator